MVYFFLKDSKRAIIVMDNDQKSNENETIVAALGKHYSHTVTKVHEKQ